MEHKQRCGAIRKFEMEHYDNSKTVIERMKSELKGYAEMTDAEMPSEEELNEAADEFEKLIQERREQGLDAVDQVSLTLAEQLKYLRTPGEDLEKLLKVVAEMKEDYHKRVDQARDSHAEFMAKSRQENVDKDVKLEDEFEFLVTTMRQVSTSWLFPDWSFVYLRISQMFQTESNRSSVRLVSDRVKKKGRQHF